MSEDLSQTPVDAAAEARYAPYGLSNADSSGKIVIERGNPNSIRNIARRLVDDKLSKGIELTSGEHVLFDIAQQNVIDDSRPGPIEAQTSPPVLG